MTVRRFRVALSFPGEKREYVRQVADALATALGKEAVLYDEYLTAELARPDLDLYLGNLYRDESELVVPFYCAEYERKKWCKLEWRQMRDILFNVEGNRIMPFRFDDAPITGVLSIDGYVSIGDRTPQEVAELILQRLGATMPGPVGTLPPDSKPSAFNLNRRIVFKWSGRPALPRHFVGRARELSALETAVVRSGAPIVIVNAIGGQGKTTLVAKWLSGYEQASSHHFEQGCYFSAYRFGVEYIGFLEFAVESLRAEGAPPNANAAVLSRHLIEIMRRCRTLLVVDGIERWLKGGQSPTDPDTGWTDTSRNEAESARGFGDLLQEITSVRNGSKLVMTTRAIPKALDNVDANATIQLEGSVRGRLTGLNELEGLLLFKRLQVRGSDVEKRKCARELEGHPLSMTLLAGILQRLGRSIESRRTVYPMLMSRDEALRSILQQAEVLCGGDVRILQAAAICHEEAPVDAVIHAIEKSPEGDKVRLTIDQLEEWGLMALVGPARSLLQLHPIVRRHFASTIKDAQPMHVRLSTYFESIAISDRARSLSKVAPRLWSVEHAAASGDYTRALGLLMEKPLAASKSSTSIGGVGNLTLSAWFQTFGQSAFELEWTHRLATGAPRMIRRVLLNSMVIAAQRCGMTETADRLINEALASDGDDDVS